MSLPDLAAQMVNKTVNDLSDDIARTIIIVGSKSVGKSNLLYSFLEKSDKPRETLVLEYSFGRKSSQKQGIEKTICHAWEYGGKLEMLKNVLVSIPIRGRFFYCVMVDLSKIRTIWHTLETCITAQKQSFTESTPDLILIGGKYNVFKNYDSEMKKTVSTTLRSMAVLYNAHLLFYSHKEPQLLRKAKEMFYNIGFGNGIPLRENNTNYTKPLMIPKGLDNWDSIGVPASTFEQIKLRHLSRIPIETEIKPEVKGLQQSHPEPILDSLAALKYEELHNLDNFDPSIDDYLLCLH